MRARPDILPHIVASRMRYWLEIIRAPIIATHIPPWKARRNYLHLVRRYPQVASRLGYTEGLSYRSPVHDLSPASESVRAPEPQKQPSAAALPATEAGSTLQRAPSAVLLEEEVL